MSTRSSVLEQSTKQYSKYVIFSQFKDNLLLGTLRTLVFVILRAPPSLQFQCLIVSNRGEFV